jgi:hypothetical protein
LVLAQLRIEQSHGLPVSERRHHVEAGGHCPRLRLEVFGNLVADHLSEDKAVEHEALAEHLEDRARGPGLGFYLLAPRSTRGDEHGRRGASPGVGELPQRIDLGLRED